MPAKARKRRTCKDPNRKQDPHYMNTIQLDFQQQPEDRSGHRQEEFEKTFNSQMQSVARAGTSPASPADASKQTASHPSNAPMNASNTTQWHWARQDISLQYDGNYSQSTYPAPNYLAQMPAPDPSYPSSQASVFLTPSAPANAYWNSTPADDYASQFNQNCEHTGVCPAYSQVPLQNQYGYFLQPHQHEQYEGHIHAPMREENLFGAAPRTQGSFYGDYDNSLGIPVRCSPHSDIPRYSGSSHAGHF